MIKNKKYRLVLDLKKNFVSNVETLVQNDVNTNEFEIELFDDGVPYLIDEKNKLEVAAKKSDGTVVVDSATGIQNTVSWQLSEQALTASGYVEAEVRVLEDTGVLTASQSFKFLVRPNLINDKTIKSTSQYRALDEAIKKAEELKKELEGVPEKVAEIKSEFDNVKTTLENTQKELLAGLQLSNKNIDEIKTYLNGVNAEIQKIKDKEIDIANLRALLANLEDLKARLATLESTLSDAKTTNTNLETNIKTSNKNISDMNALINTARDVGNSLTSDTTVGKSVDNALKGSITKGNQIVTNVNNADKTITEKINTATTTGKSLDESVQKGGTTKTNLDVSIKTAETTKTNLDSSNTTATTTKTELDKSIELAKTKKTELDGSVSTAKTTKTALDRTIKMGKDVNTKSASLKAELDASVTSATNAKTDVDKSVEIAKTTKTDLDGSIASATAKNSELKDTTTTAETTDTEAQKTIETLQALLTKSEGSEQSLREIIASGNLDKYVTDPKLQEALKDYATKTELENIDVTSKLGDYALKTDVKTKLSEMVEDETHRTVTDAEKNAWNSKIGKGDDISDNIVVYNECTDDVCYANTKKTISEALDYINQSWQDSTAQLVNLYVDLQSDVAGLKTSKASTTDIKTKLSEMTSDATHRTVTDTEKTTWNNKVDKVSGKGLSTNDFTSSYKKKLDNLSSAATGSEATTSTRGYMSAADKKKLDGIDLSKYAETELVNALGQEIRAIGEITTQKADKTDIKTKLSELTDDSTHRTVTDSEKSTWNNKLSTVSGQDVSRAKAKGYSSASSWTSVGSSRDVEDWIGDFDKRTRENKTAISGKVNQSDIVDMKKCKILTQSEYDALSSTEKNRADTLYFIKE